MTRPVTIRTVAERAGCSIATVSRVINGSARTSPEVQTRVRQAVEELGFRPSEIGRSLKTLRTRMLGVVIPSLTNPVYAAAVSGMEAEARRRGHKLLLTTTEYDPRREEDAVSALLARSVAGLLLTVADPDENATLDGLDEAALPYVLVYNEPRLGGRASVSVDNTKAMRAVTRCIMELGHRRVLFVARRIATSDRSRLRYRGYCLAMEEFGAAPWSALEVDQLDDAVTHMAMLREAFSRGDLPTAIICGNDILALSITAALRGLGLRVPADISVAGFDGISMGRMANPSLATVAQPTHRIGERAVEKLFNIMEQGAPRLVELLPFSLLSGGTVAAAPLEPAHLVDGRRPSLENAELM